MDNKNLFNPPIPGTNQKRFIGLTDALEYLPLIYGINNSLVEHDFDIRFGNIIENANRLREGEIELGIISPLDYAKKKETWISR